MCTAEVRNEEVEELHLGSGLGLGLGVVEVEELHLGSGLGLGLGQLTSAEELNSAGVSGCVFALAS